MTYDCNYILGILFFFLLAYCVCTYLSSTCGKHPSVSTITPTSSFEAQVIGVSFKEVGIMVKSQTLYYA